MLVRFALPYPCFRFIANCVTDTPAKVAQSILLFCKGQGLLTSVVMPGVDRQRAFSTSSGGSNGEPRRLSRGELKWMRFDVNWKRKLAWSMMMNRILSRFFFSSSFLVSFPLFKQACPWRSTTSRTSDDSRSQSTTSCHRSRPRNKCIRPSAPPDGPISSTLRFRHISIQNRACISLTFRLTSSGWAVVSRSLRRDRILAHNRFG